LDENLVDESLVAMGLPVSFSAKEAAAVLPYLNTSSSMKGFLWRGFLNPSLAVNASITYTLLLETVVDAFEEDFLRRETMNLVIQALPLVL
jgi:hypothetical protein